jgi:hypothetical protein
LIIKNFQRYGYLELDEPYDSEVKVDRHMMRISVGNHVASIEGGGDVRIDRFVALRHLYRDVTRENASLLESMGFDMVDLCDTKYAIGSELCMQKNKAVCADLCPLDCDMLVRIDRNNTFITYPSETRRDGVPGTGKWYMQEQLGLW